MKKSSLVILTVLAALVLTWGTRAEAQTFLGEFCWNVTINEKTAGSIAPETFVIRTGVSSVGGSYFRLQGITTFPADGPLIVDGAAILQGSKVFLTFKSTQDHTPFEAWRDSSNMQMVLNVSTLSGTFWDVGTGFNTATRAFSPFYSAGTSTLVTCPGGE